MTNYVDIVLPCYNPPAQWVDVVIQSVKNLEAHQPGLQVNLYLVNDGSTASVAAADIDQLKASLHHVEYINYADNRGKGYALRAGIAQTQHNWCIYTDIDFPYSEESFLSLYEELMKGKADIVVGIRNKAYYDKVPLLRTIISRVLKFFIRLFLKIPTTDTQCGLKGFNAKGKEVFLKTSIDRYLFDLEFIYLGSKTPGVKIQLHEVVLREGILFRRMNFKILINESINFLRILLRIK